MNKLPDILSDDKVRSIIDAALKEDLAEAGDVTTKALISEDIIISAEIISRAEYSISGTKIGEAVFGKLEPSVNCDILIEDGCVAHKDDVVMRINGKAMGILTAERTALNFMQRMTGIASLTNEFVNRVRPYNVTILDTRKTVPGHRVLDKYAVLCGGGTNHRKGLSDMVMIKDNHRNLWRSELSGDLGQAVKEAKKKYPEVPIEVEVETVEDLENALSAEPDWIMLDNMPPDELKRSVVFCSGRCKLEASGGITMDNLEDVAKSGVDAISLGCLTHSAPAADLSLEISLDG